MVGFMYRRSKVRTEVLFIYIIVLGTQLVT